MSESWLIFTNIVMIQTRLSNMAVMYCMAFMSESWLIFTNIVMIQTWFSNISVIKIQIKDNRGGRRSDRFPFPGIFLSVFQFPLANAFPNSHYRFIENSVFWYNNTIWPHFPSSCPLSDVSPHFSYPPCPLPALQSFSHSHSSLMPNTGYTPNNIIKNFQVLAFTLLYTHNCTEKLDADEKCTKTAPRRFLILAAW